jgi:hypothetical protein
MLDPSELATRFTYHPPTGDQSDRYQSIRNAGRAFAGILDASCPDSREKSLAMTNLEQAIMWANAAIARREGTGHAE